MQSNSRNLAFVDVDSTLLNPKGRIHSLWKTWLLGCNGLTTSTREAALRLPARSMGRGFQDCVAQFTSEVRAELTDHLDDALEFWEENFWKQEYLALDFVFEGANILLREIRRKFKVCFLTGRYQDRMQESTIAQLTRFGLWEQGSDDLIMNPNLRDHASFKSSTFLSHASGYSNIIALDDDLTFLQRAHHSGALSLGFVTNIDGALFGPTEEANYPQFIWIRSYTQQNQELVHHLSRLSPEVD